ncbi:unnamed protein product [Euphydryas editha]|uniref:Uncharacterized protein n=1 Tax=Euphydryas editha TaxID=104508 RepID=A0AAU9UQV1_EUPED|nr:unnamed protein product [Euphydryas editha]
MARALRSDTVSIMSPLLRSNLPPALDDLDKAECLANSLQSQCSPSTEPMTSGTSSRLEARIEPTTLGAENRVTANCANGSVEKAPGPDQIWNKMLKRLPHQLIMLLVAIFNSLLAGCSFPDHWKEAKKKYIKII